MLATLADFERAPRILRLNVAGQPVEWLSWQDAVCLYARELVVWTLGDAVLEFAAVFALRRSSLTSTFTASSPAKAASFRRSTRAAADEPGAVPPRPQHLPVLRTCFSRSRSHARSCRAALARRQRRLGQRRRGVQALQSPQGRSVAARAEHGTARVAVRAELRGIPGADEQRADPRRPDGLPESAVRRR